jgi:carboxylesterase type B
VTAPGRRHRLVTALVSLLSAPFAAAQEGDASCTAPVVETTAGDVCGIRLEVDGAVVNAYLGIPYGEDTSGSNRFMPPLPRRPWQGVMAATAPGPACPQTLTSQTEAPADQSEDCLFLNVWAAAEAAGDAPVLVFVHGGGFLVGTATDTLASPEADWYNIDGRFLAAELGLVVVSMDYRLGAFGFLSGVAGLEGNQGPKDQQLALEWVRDNAAAFGGDPGNVTLMCESAGGTSVSAHVYAVPSSEGLFHRAIIESNPLGLGDFVSQGMNPYLGDAMTTILFGKPAGEVMREHYLRGADDLAAAVLDASGDYVFMCPAELAAMNAPVGYHYRFSHPPQYVGGLTGGEACSDKTCHAVELPYVFGTGRFPGGFSAADGRVSSTLMELWAAFARGEGDDGSGFASWPPAVGDGGYLPTLVVSDPVAVAAFDVARCACWAEVYDLQ